MTNPADRQLATEIGALFGGNGLTHEQQVELVAVKIGEYREAACNARMSRGLWMGERWEPPQPCSRLGDSPHEIGVDNHPLIPHTPSRMKTTTRVPNPAFDQTIALLIELGYQCSDQFVRKPLGQPYSRGTILPEEHFELWYGPRGCVIVQKWTKGNGCNLYTDWTVGHTFTEMRVNLARVAKEEPASADRS